MPLLRIMLLLFAGAALTVATSLVALPLGDRWAGSRAITEDDRQWVHSHAPAGLPSDLVENYVNESLGYRRDMFGGPGRTLTTGPAWSCFRTRTGLPWSAFESKRWLGANTPATTSHGTIWIPWIGVEITAQPLPVGFAANTLFYAAALALVIEFVRHSRRNHRAFRGKCRDCAYPVGDQRQCSECGAAIPSSARSTDRTMGFLPWLWRHHRLHALARMMVLGAILSTIIAIMLAVGAPRGLRLLDAAESGLKDRSAAFDWFRTRCPDDDVDDYSHVYEMRSVGCERLAATSRNSGRGTRIYRYRAGWPLYSFEGMDWAGMSHLPMDSRVTSSHSTLFVTARLAPIGIPLRPMLVGFAVNTLFYAGLLALYVWVRLRMRGARAA